MPNMFIIRGLPGSGKTTLARQIAGCRYEADQWLEKFNGGKFDGTKLKQAHAWCLEQVSAAMNRLNPDIAVSNTFTRHWEYEPYLKLAEKHGYTVFVIIANGNFKSVHGVPEETIAKMRERFEY